MENKLFGELEKVFGGVLEDIKKIAKDYGAIFVVIAVAIYLWKKLYKGG